MHAAEGSVRLASVDPLIATSGEGGGGPRERGGSPSRWFLTLWLACGAPFPLLPVAAHLPIMPSSNRRVFVICVDDVLSESEGFHRGVGAPGRVSIIALDKQNQLTHDRSRPRRAWGNITSH